MFVLFLAIHSRLLTKDYKMLFDVKHVFHSSFLEKNAPTQLTANVFSGLGNLQTLLVELTKRKVKIS